MNILEKIGVTPGPWRWSREYGVEIKSPLSGWKAALDFSDGEKTPDRRLVCAAPEMLEDEVRNSADAEKAIKCLDSGDCGSARCILLRIMGRSLVGAQNATGLKPDEIREMMEDNGDE